MIPIPQNAAHWHVILVHAPALFFMVSVVMMSLATIWNDVRWQRVALWFIVATAAITAITFKFGEEAEHLVRMLPDTKGFIHPHEELAEAARNIIIPFGILILALWWFTRKHTILPAWLSWGSVVIMIGIIILLMNVAELGGKINHPEIRPGWVPGSSPAAIQHNDEDDDDED
ncbi:MAG: hypothetical protein KDB65_00615 [Calditrichaeota bacterium]|nr:hypothetical protein [Calditrichota bacterium]MCB9369282.1 hypothetical protein [Calditrichota bacterium]